MTSDVLTWGAVFAALGSIVATARLWMGMGATKQQAETAASSAQDAHKRIDRLSETSATADDIAAAERRFTDAVNGLRSDFQEMTRRLDTLLSALVQHKA